MGNTSFFVSRLYDMKICGFWLLSILFGDLYGSFLGSSNPQPIGFRGNLLVKRQKFFYCTYSLGITETS